MHVRRSRLCAIVVTACLVMQPTLLRADQAYSVAELAAQYTTPQAIAKFLQDNFTFQRDIDIFGEIEHWQTPEEFAQRKIGDCEDYALLACELLDRNGVEAHVFSLFGEQDYAHTVCIYVDRRGRYNLINQDKHRYYRAKSLEELASKLHKDWIWGGIVRRLGIRGQLVQEIRNRGRYYSLGQRTHTIIATSRQSTY